MAASKSKKSSSAPPMPGLVFNEINLTPPKIKKPVSKTVISKKNSPNKTSSISSPRSSPNSQSSLLWAGVVSCMIIIVIISGWALKLKFASLSWQTSQEKMLLDKTNYSWNKATLATSHDTDLQQELDKSKVKDALSELMTTTTSSTPTTTF